MAYQGWYHVMGNTYGTWLPGDERGWRSWKHHEHCEGDYRNPPPPGKYTKKLERAISMMKRLPVLLTKQQRPIVCRALAARTIELGAHVIDFSMSEMHFHGLVNFDAIGEWIEITQLESRGIAITRRCSAMHRVGDGTHLVRIVHGLKPESALQDNRDPVPRHIIGIAKKHASHVLRAAGLRDVAAPGGLFAMRSKIKPIADADHKDRVARYIFNHTAEDAAVLSLLEPRGADVTP